MSRTGGLVRTYASTYKQRVDDSITSASNSTKTWPESTAGRASGDIAPPTQPKSALKPSRETGGGRVEPDSDDRPSALNWLFPGSMKALNEIGRPGRPATKTTLQSALS